MKLMLIGMALRLHYVRSRARPFWSQEVPWIWSVKGCAADLGRRSSREAAIQRGARKNCVEQAVAVQRIDSEALSEALMSLSARLARVTRESRSPDDWVGDVRIVALPGTLTLTRLDAQVIESLAEARFNLTWIALGARFQVVQRRPAWRASISFDLGMVQGLAAYQALEVLGYRTVRNPAPDQFAFSKYVAAGGTDRTNRLVDLDRVLALEFRRLEHALGAIQPAQWTAGSVIVHLSVESHSFRSTQLEFSFSTLRLLAKCRSQVVLDYA